MSKSLDTNLGGAKMDYDLDEFLEEYDDFTRQVQGGDYNIFPSRLSQWMHLIDEEDADVSQHIRWLRTRPGADEAYTSLVHFKGGMSDSVLNIPPDRLDRLSAQLLLFSDLNSGKVKFLDFSHALFYDRNVNASLGKMIDGLFTPFASELRRYIKRNFDEPVPEFDTIDPKENIIVPASDRLVTINHNAPQIIELTELLSNIEEDIRGRNDIDPGIRSVALSELRASKEILEADSARVGVIQTLVLGCLIWIGTQIAEYAASSLLTGAETLIKAYFGV